MTHELTHDGLFSYFEPILVEQIIELPLVKRHLSACDYFKCIDTCSILKQNLGFVPNISGTPIHAILSFNALKQAPINELREYFGIEQIRAAYLQCFGDYFTRFESKIMTSNVTSVLGYMPYSPLINESQQKVLILHIKAAMSLPLQVFTNAIIEQDFLLQEIAALLIYQASKAKLFIAAIQADDTKYKQVIVSLAFSVLKMGLGAFNVSELINVSQSISTLASSALDKIERELLGLVSDIQNLIVYTHFQVIAEAEKDLLSSVAPEDMVLRWVIYRAHIFHNANKSIKHILDTCVNNDDFYRCIIGETVAKHDDLTEETLQIHATERARLYIANIALGIQAQINKIRIVRDSVLSKEGGEKIELYFRKICLINYTLSLETSSALQSTWITKPLGHRLSYYFPEVIFQKKWAPVRLHNYIHSGVMYCKQKMPLEAYKERRRNAPVILGLFRNSSRVKHELFSQLEDQLPCLSDGLIQELQQQRKPIHLTLCSDDYYDTHRTRYSFRRRQLSLFSFSELPFAGDPIKPIPQTAQSMVILPKNNVNDRCVQ